MESYVNWLLWINFVSTSVKGQPLYKGQNARSQCVRYSEVPLYIYFYSFVPLLIMLVAWLAMCAANVNYVSYEVLIVLRSILLLISLSNKQGVRGFPRNIHNSSCIASTHSLVWYIEDTKSILMNYTRMFQFGGGLAYSKRSSILTLKSTSPDFVLISLSLSKSNTISQSLA